MMVAWNAIDVVTQNMPILALLSSPYFLVVEVIDDGSREFVSGMAR